VSAASGIAAACWKLGRQGGVRRRDVLGDRAGDAPVHLVAGAEGGHQTAYRRHTTGEVRARDGELGSTRAKAESGARGAHQIGAAAQDEPVGGVDRRGMHAHQHVVVADRGLVDVAQLQVIG